MNKNMMWGLVVVALVVGAVAGFYFERVRATVKMDDMKMVMQKQIDDARKMAIKSQENSMMRSQSLVMMASSSALGAFVTAANNMTLYVYDKDQKNDSYCTGQCAKTWPPYLVIGSAPSNLPEHLTVFKRDDGSMQYAWDGKPLYYYSGDKASGDTRGDGIGGIWHVAK